MDLIKTEAERKMIDDLFVLSPALVAELDRQIAKRNELKRTKAKQNENMREKKETLMGKFLSLSKDNGEPRADLNKEEIEARDKILKELKGYFTLRAYACECGQAGCQQVIFGFGDMEFSVGLDELPDLVISIANAAQGVLDNDNIPAVKRMLERIRAFPTPPTMQRIN